MHAAEKCTEVSGPIDGRAGGRADGRTKEKEGEREIIETISLLSRAFVPVLILKKSLFRMHRCTYTHADMYYTCTSINLYSLSA